MAKQDAIDQKKRLDSLILRGPLVPEIGEVSALPLTVQKIWKRKAVGAITIKICQNGSMLMIAVEIHHHKNSFY